MTSHCYKNGTFQEYNHSCIMLLIVIPEEYFSTPLFPIQYWNLRMNSIHKMAANSRQRARKLRECSLFL